MGIKLKRSAVAGKAPVVGDLELGELAVNTTDGKLFTKKSVSGTESIVEVGGVSSVAGKTGAVTLAKADVGLGNVDNTSDANKPISSATQTALNGKAASTHTHTASQVTDLGTAATRNVGTAANNVVALDGSAKLPAVDGSQLTNLPTGGAGRLLRAPRVLTSGTSYTTPADCTSIYVELVGGGGGGGGTDAGNGSTAVSGGGGSGAYAAKYFTVSPNTSYTYAIGAAGTAGNNTGTNGGNGGNTTFTVGGVTVTAFGGSGSSGENSFFTGTRFRDGGAGGDTPTNGDFNNKGNPGGFGMIIDGNTDAHKGGLGAPSMFGTTYGAGGNGTSTASTSGSAGTAGTAGVIRIWEFA